MLRKFLSTLIIFSSCAPVMEGKVVSTPAQKKQPGISTPTPIKSLVLSSPRELRRVSEGYAVGPGDLLVVKVWDQPELSGEVRVERDGTIILPIVGSVNVDGKTVREISNILEEKLKLYIKKPQVVVQVKEYAARRVYVLGEVKNPGMIPLLGETTLIEAIALAGGILPDAFLQGTYLIRKNRAYPLNLYRLFVEGDMSENIYLSSGDIIFVPSVAFRKVFVIGEVRKPGEVLMTRNNMTLLEAIAYAGGFDLGAKRDDVKIIRDWPASPQVFTINVNDLLKEKTDVSMSVLKPGDIVYVPRHPLKSADEVIQLVTPLISTFITTPLQTITHSLYIWNTFK